MADTRTGPARFTQVEAADIIREASVRTLSGEYGERALTREDLAAMARELGVNESALEQVLVAREQRKTSERRKRLALMGWMWHATSYAVVLSALVVVDLMTGPGWWVQWPALGWGIGLAMHTASLVLGAFNRRLDSAQSR
jgi:hypothetical protein